MMQKETYVLEKQGHDMMSSYEFHLQNPGYKSNLYSIFFYHKLRIVSTILQTQVMSELEGK